MTTRPDGLPLVAAPDGTMATPKIAEALWAIHDAFSTGRSGVKPWRYLPCGCRTDGIPCVQHDPALADYWARNSLEAAQAGRDAMNERCKRELADLRRDIEAEWAARVPMIEAAE